MNSAVSAESLDRSQRALEEHFAILAATRRKLGLPVFAIEHGLEKETLAEIAGGIRSRLVDGFQLSKHWLLWVIYAAEVGYDYDGEEYWQSFEQRTPSWSFVIARRQYLRQWYSKFHELYEGVVPTGSWANQFSIIAGPITHALLPKDLQLQLARILYEHRYAVAELIDAPPSEVGRFMWSAAYFASSRFRNFLEQEELVGRIVLALLGAGHSGAMDSILNETFLRIVHDLESVQRAKDWLREARTAAASAKVRFDARKARRGIDPNQSTEARNLERAESKAVRPSISLQRAGDGWIAVLEIPSFAGLASAGSRIGNFIKATRCRLPSAGGGWHPRGWLLHGPQRVTLTAWPEPSQPVIRFEQWDEGTHHFLTSECRISAGPRWLFRIGIDGKALEVAGPIVSPGHAYVVLQTQALSSDAILTPTPINCLGTHASMFTVPDHPPPDYVRALGELGLQVRRMLTVWPAGLPTIYAGTETCLEWLESDAKLLGVMHRGGCIGVELQLDGELQSLALTLATNEPAFVDLGALPSGTRTLTVTNLVQELGAEKVSRVRTTWPIIIRPPHRWIPGESGHSGFVVTVEPHSPSLEDVLAQRVDLQIAGPSGRSVVVRLQLLDGAGQPLLAEELSKFVLPMGPDIWRVCIDRWHARNHDPSFAFRASAGRLTVEAEGMGSWTLPLRHQIVPIRWLARGKKSLELQLTDDTGQEEDLVYEAASFLEPTKLQRLHPADRTPILTPTGHGGLYVATCGVHRVSMVASMPGIVSLSGLADRPMSGPPLRDGQQVVSLLKTICDWSTARVAGPIGPQRAAFAIRAMEDQLFETICSTPWIEAERRYRERASPEVLEDAVGRQVSFALSVSKARHELFTESPDDSAEQLRNLCLLYHIANNARLCQAALRLATTPGRFMAWAGFDAVPLLDELASNQVLMRSARMAALLVGDLATRRASGWPA